MDKLTDIEICKRIAEIGNIAVINTGENLFLRSQLSKLYDPLTDDALCFQLMVKYKVLFTPIPISGNYSARIWCGDNHIGGHKSNNPNKSICLCIIEAHSD